MPCHPECCLHSDMMIRHKALPTCNGRILQDNTRASPRITAAVRCAIPMRDWAAHPLITLQLLAEPPVTADAINPAGSLSLFNEPWGVLLLLFRQGGALLVCFSKLLVFSGVFVKSMKDSIFQGYTHARFVLGSKSHELTWQHSVHTQSIFHTLSATFTCYGPLPSQVSTPEFCRRGWIIHSHKNEENTGRCKEPKEMPHPWSWSKPGCMWLWAGWFGLWFSGWQPVHVRKVGTRWILRSLPIQAIPWF